MTDASLHRAYRSLLWRMRLRRGLEAAAMAACTAALCALAGTTSANAAVIAAAVWFVAYLGLQASSCEAERKRIPDFHLPGVGHHAAIRKCDNTESTLQRGQRTDCIEFANPPVQAVFSAGQLAPHRRMQAVGAVLQAFAELLQAHQRVPGLQAAAHMSERLLVVLEPCLHAAGEA